MAENVAFATLAQWAPCQTQTSECQRGFVTNLGRRSRVEAVDQVPGVNPGRGALFGLLIGMPHAWLAVLALGLDAPLDIPVPTLLATAAVIIVLTILAGLLAARRAATTSPVEAMRMD